MFEVAGQAETLDRCLGQQRAFSAAVEQQGDRLLSDRCLHEQQVAVGGDWHFRHAHQRAYAADRGQLVWIACTASSEAEQYRECQQTTRHGVAFTCTLARTAAPSASSTVSL